MSRPTLARRSVDVVTGAVGSLLGVVFYLVGTARGDHRRALHPTGQVVPGVLYRYGSAVSTGVRWLDEPGTDNVLLRLSRATGLPRPLPDVFGLALRIPLEDGGHGDLLLSTTGIGRVTRYLLRPVRTVATSYTSLFPYRAAQGPLLLAAIPESEDGATFHLAWARPTGSWQRFGLLKLPKQMPTSDSTLAFKPVEHPVPGLPSYPWAANLRRYPYAVSRRARRVSSRLR
jgi:hypothetical protein